MRRIILSLAIAFGLLAPAHAVVQGTYIGNANYTVLNTDQRLFPTAALTATRTISLPPAAATCIGQTCPANALEIIDYLGNVGGANSCYTIAPFSGDTINGSTASITFCGTNGRATLIPTGPNQWSYQSLASGQYNGTTTNDNATAGNIGEVITSGLCPGPATTATITVTIAAPGVVTWTAHGITGACPVVFTTTGALPTGITSSTTYYTVPSSITTNTFQIATTVANALAGTSITTTGTQSGTQTGTAGVALATTTAATVTGIALTAGDWDCRAMASRTLAASTSVTKLTSSINATATTIGTQGLNSTSILQTAANVMGAAGEDQDLGPTRISLAATTNQFLVMADTFTVSTDTGFGSLVCRRVR